MDFYEELARLGVTVAWVWCTTTDCPRAVDEGMTVCHPCAAAHPTERPDQ